MSLLNGLLTAIVGMFSPKRSPAAKPAGTASLRTPLRAPSSGAAGGVQTVEVDPARTDVRIAYAPDHDGDPDAGEIVWTWVPYAENDGRGKDRPVLVVGRRDSSHVYAVRLTSKSHDGDRDFLSIGSGPWDPQRRQSWVDIDQLYVVHHDGMRREASALDLDAFTRVAAALQKRFGWKTA